MKYEDENVDKVLLENELVVMHKTDYVHYMDKPHFHDGYEIHFTLTNATTYQIDERTFVADAGSIALFNPEEIHRVGIDRDKLYERYFLLFKPRFIEEILVTNPFLLDIYNSKVKIDCFQLTTEQQTKVTGIFEEILLAQVENENTVQKLKSKIKLVELLLLFSEILEGDTKKQRAVSYENHHIFSEIIKYIKESYMDEITLDKLSQEFFISKSTIIRMFKNIIGMTPAQYLIYVRIMKSRSLLEKGNTVKFVSEQVGYKDESSYIKKFKELQGVSPKQYTLQLLGNKEEID